MIEVEIWSDIACPFCFIGKKNFEEALKRYANREMVKVTWRSFELDPNALKSQKTQIYEILAQKYGRSVEWARTMNQNLALQGKSLGLDFNFDALIPSNSFDAHRLLHLASKQGKESKVIEGLFVAYFTEGKDIALKETLKPIGLAAGLSEDDIEACLNTKAFEAEVREDESTAAELGLNGVPAFVFNQKLLVSGAQPPEAFLEVFSEIASS